MKVPFSARDPNAFDMNDAMQLLEQRIAESQTRSGAGIGIGPSTSGYESNWPVRPAPPAEHMRSETPTSAARRIWPRLR
jgi:hypothetical protein